MQSKQRSQKTVSKPMQTAGDLRRFLAEIAVAVANGDMPVADANAAVKACSQINTSINAEIKNAALQMAAKKISYDIGLLPLQLTDKQ